MKAVKGLQNGKVPVIYSITAELLKADMAFSAENVHQLMNTSKYGRMRRARRVGGEG